MPVLFSFFRVAWILLAVLGALLLFLVRGRGRGPRIVAAVLVCAALAGTAGRLVSPSAARYQHELATRAGEIGIGLDNYRAREYSAVWTEIKQRPVAGSGFGTEYRADWTIYRSWAHNAYEWLWWRLGLFGLVSFLALVVGAIATGLAAARRLDGAERGLALGLVAGVGFTALAANLHENFENYQTNLFVALALAQLIALRCRAEARS
jgi:O-antigen ligase